MSRTPPDSHWPNSCSVESNCHRHNLKASRRHLQPAAARPGLLERSLAHAAYHGGQVVFLAKLWAGDRWDSLSIPLGQSAAFNATLAASKAPYSATGPARS